ncbi:low affinity iron permease family protein [Crocosphaera sp. UHCC 0190]|uniref:low affinity iron permease family protein n=1 Tax=Crocosphaera sp. UHCC 0190 TaxID=3110246 RepID=UPI002B1FEF41|nr:low affinity iron permease family protein [Crocosphaera sp. UHCC 0190]MEA5509411.1 low affinity iron permease family protein [Crocosphaera sp. UHCC 0190]
MRKERHKKSLFYKLTSNTAEAVGSPVASILAFSVIIVWAITGPLFKFSDTWQLCINTGTTIVTFLMVFLIQNSQNRDAKAVQLKLDELIRSSSSAHNEIIDVEESSQEELEQLAKDYSKLANNSQK